MEGLIPIFLVSRIKKMMTWVFFPLLWMVAELHVIVISDICKYCEDWTTIEKMYVCLAIQIHTTGKST